MDKITAAAQMIIAIATLATLVFTVQQIKVSRNLVDEAVQRQLTDRFTAAVSGLGSAAEEVRLGGIYALERIARDSARDESV